MRRAAFTLIELLVSIALGMLLIALGTSALLHVSRVFNRNLVMLQARDDAGAIQQRLNAAISAMYHPAQLACRAEPGESAPATVVWANGNEAIELTWMSSLDDLEERAMDTEPAHYSDLVWNRLRWQGRGVGKEGGTLSYAISSASTLSSPLTSSNSNYRLNFGTASAPSWLTQSGTVRGGPQPRRDRRRPLDDNDLRHLPGITAGVYAAAGLKGDDADLASRLRPMHPPRTRVAGFAVEWVDQDGWTTRCDAAGGITIRDPAGTVQPPLGQPWADAQRLVLDGTWLDGRAAAAAGTTRTAAGQRPLQITVSFVLIPCLDSDPEDISREAHIPFVLTFRAAPTLPRL